MSEGGIDNSEVDKLKENDDDKIVDDLPFEESKEQQFKDVFETVKLYLMSDKLYEFKCFLNLLFSYFGLLVLFWINVPGYAHSLFIFFNIFFFLRLNLNSFNYLARLEILNLVLTKWLDTFIVQYIGYCCDDLTSRIVIGCLHVLICFLLYYFKKEGVFYLHILLHLVFTVNNPFFLGMIECFKRLIFTTVLFHVEYVYFLVFIPTNLDRPVYLINAIVPLIKLPSYLALLYFAILISIRILFFYNEKKTVYKMLTKHVQDLKNEKESETKQYIMKKDENFTTPVGIDMDNLPFTNETKEPAMSLAGNLTSGSIMFLKNTIDGLDKTIVNTSAEMITKASSAFQPPSSLFNFKKKTALYDYAKINELSLNQTNLKSTYNDANVLNVQRTENDEKSTIIKPVNFRKIYSNNQ